MNQSDPKNIFVPFYFVTGLESERSSSLLLATKGYMISFNEKNEGYLSLYKALKWNKLEIKDSQGAEKAFRIKLVQELETISSVNDRFAYSKELVKLRKLAFEKPNRHG